MQSYNNFQWNKHSQYGIPKIPHAATTFYATLNDLELCFLSWESENFADRFVILEIRANLAQRDFLKKLGFHFISFVQTTALHGIHWKSEIKWIWHHIDITFQQQLPEMMRLLTNILTSITKNLEKWGTFQSEIWFLKKRKHFSYLLLMTYSWTLNHWFTTLSVNNGKFLKSPVKKIWKTAYYFSSSKTI